VSIEDAGNDPNASIENSGSGNDVDRGGMPRRIFAKLDHLGGNLVYFLFFSGVKGRVIEGRADPTRQLAFEVFLPRQFG